MAEGVSAMSDWLYMTPPGGGDPHKFPSGEGVQAFYEARGYEVTDEPEEQPFVPPKTIEQAGDEWVILHHSEAGASHEFPNNPAAIQGAYEAGWQATPPKAAEPEPEPEKPAAKKAASKPKASTEPAADNESKE